MQEEIKIEIFNEQNLPSRKKIYLALIVYFLTFGGGIIIYHLNFFSSAIMHALGSVYIQCIMYISFPLWYYTNFQRKIIFPHLIFYLIVFFTTFFIREKVLSSYFSFLYLTSWLIIVSTLKQMPHLTSELLLSGEKLKVNIFIGLGVGCIFCLHLFFSVKLSGGFSFVKPQTDDFIYWFLYGISLNSLGEELFFRGLFFKEFIRYGAGFWVSAISSSLFFASRYLASPDALLNPAMTLGLFFYLIAGGIISCFLVDKTKSLIPSIVLNVCFNSIANLVVIKI